MGRVILEEKNRLFLREGGADHIVKRGEVLVILAPYDGADPLRRMYLGTAKEGDIIPSPVITHAGPTDGKKRSFGLILEGTMSGTVLEEVRIPAGEPEQWRFFTLSEEAGFYNVRGDKGEFWNAVLEKYERSREEKRSAIRNRVSYRSGVKGRVKQIVADAFLRAISSHALKVPQNDRGIYDASAFLCKYRGIAIQSYEDLKAVYGDTKEPDISDIARLSGFSVREAMLGKNWTRSTETGFIGFIHEGDANQVVVVFYRSGRLYLFIPFTGEIRPLKKEERDSISPKVLYFDRPFKRDPVRFKDVLTFAVKEISISDIAILLAASFLLSLVGVALSALSQSIYDQIIPGQKESLIYVVGTIFLATLAANFLFAIAKNLTDYRISTKAGTAVQLAIFHRVFHLPEEFFRGRESAAQAYRIMQLSSTYTNVLKSGMDITIGLLFSLIYLRRMFKCSPALAHVGLWISAFCIVITFTAGTMSRRISRIRMQQTAGIRSFLYQTFTGIGTIRMAGAEGDVLERYMEKEGVILEQQGRLDRIKRRSSLAVSLLNGISMLLMYWIMGSQRAGNITLGVFMGFIAANAMFSSQVLKAASSLSTMVAMLPIIKDTGELLMTIPEVGDEGRTLPEFRGDIKLSQVSYGYKGTGKTVLRDISLHIRPGEYVGIVGPSGCGKSTLMRLLLGFARPDRGQIYYDDVPMSKLNTVELRRKVGCVLQDGSLVSGSILHNIRIVNPHAGIEAVEKAVETAGLTEEIAAMPMGLMTHVSEDALTISGGQKQRILIARAILGSPKILMFDEATSSLDNIAQEKISNALSLFHATRIVVAHRLSTVRLCDRILVMKDGNIVEEGTYDELMERKGYFYEMVKVQSAV